MSTDEREPSVTPSKRPGIPVGQTGFTLLEVLIAMAILAVSLSSLMGSQMNSMAATAYARDLTSIALLAERQLIEIEFQHRLDGWVSSDTTIEGDFSEFGYDDVDWTCTIHFIELPEYNEMMESKEGADEASGEGSDNIMDGGDQAFGALGVFWGTMIKPAIENSIRKVDCSVTWTQGQIDQEFTIQTFWTDPVGLTRMPEAGGEFSDEDDPSGNEGGGGLPGGTSGTSGTSGKPSGGTAPSTRFSTPGGGLGGGR